jgi:ABC-type proline/glycine betaine transport system ATPase subunit
MNSFERLQDKLFMLQDKIKMMRMIVAHAETELLELDELILDIMEDKLEKKLKKIG